MYLHDSIIRFLLAGRHRNVHKHKPCETNITELSTVKKPQTRLKSHNEKVNYIFIHGLNIENEK